jgi:hypothetical protein
MAFLAHHTGDHRLSPLTVVRTDHSKLRNVPTNPIAQLNLKALIFGAGVYVAVYALHAGGLTFVGNVTPGVWKSQVFVSLDHFVSLVTWAIAGYVAGRIATARGILHGVVVGVLCVFITAFGLYVLGVFTSWARVGTSVLSGWLLGMFVCTLAGGVGELYARRVSRM